MKIEQFLFLFCSLLLIALNSFAISTTIGIFPGWHSTQGSKLLEQSIIYLAIGFIMYLGVKNKLSTHKGLWLLFSIGFAIFISKINIALVFIHAQMVNGLDVNFMAFEIMQSLLFILIMLSFFYQAIGLLKTKYS